jgi:rare lipoprotein A
MFLACLAGCARRNAPPLPRSVRIGDTETGLASWYGAPYHGRRAASGETYDMEQLTAAHKTLPFQTWVEVTNLDNGKRVDVRIIDRGPFVKGRIVDLSLAAARQIEMVGPGTARVKLKVIEAPRNESPTVETFAVQAGAFSDRTRAQAFADSLRDRFNGARVVQSATLYKVVVGNRMTLDQANQLAQRLREVSGEAVVIADR